MLSRLWPSPLLLLLFVLNAASVARAESGANPPGYTDAINQALAELEAQNYPEAREEFRRAHEIFPNARTLRGLGMVEFELRNYVESVKMLEQALASEVKPLDGKLRADTEGLLQRARRYLGEVVLELDPPSASLTIDGLGVDSTRGPLLLDVGEHTFEAQAPGRTTERRSVRLEGGARISLKIKLRELEAGGVAGAPLQPAGSDSRSEVQPAYKKWWVWTLVAVVVVGGATTAAVLLTRDKDTQTTGVGSTNTPPGVTLYTLERF